MKRGHVAEEFDSAATCCLVCREAPLELDVNGALNVGGCTTTAIVATRAKAAMGIPWENQSAKPRTDDTRRELLFMSFPFTDSYSQTLSLAQG